PAERLYHLHELPCPAVRQVVAVDAGDHDVLQAHLTCRDGDVLRLHRIDHARHARLDVAERAGAGAHVAQDHHRRVLLGPALADIRTGRFLAHRVEIEFAHQLTRLVIALADGRLDPDPVGLALPFGTRAFRYGCAGEIVHAAHLVVALRSCQPFPGAAWGEHEELCRTDRRLPQLSQERLVCTARALE